MGKNINQLLTQATTFQSLDKMYLGRSPYDLTDDRWFYYSDLASAISGNGTFVTVGGTGGAQYATYFEAWTAGKFNTYQISDTTETQQFTFSGTNTALRAFGKKGVNANFGAFSVLSSSALQLLVYSNGVNWNFNNSTTAGFFLGSGSIYRFIDSNIGNVGSISKPLIAENGGSATTKVYLENSDVNLVGATGGFNVDNFYMDGGEVICAGILATGLVTTALFASFNNVTISGTPAPGTMINATNLYINNILNTTTAATGPMLIIGLNLNMTNYFDNNFASGTTNFQVSANGNGYLSNVKLIGGFALQSNSFITISNCVLDSFTDAAGAGGGTIYSSNNQWINSGGTFTFPNTGAGVKNYIFNSNHINNDVVVNNDATLIGLLTTNGDFTISNNVSRVQATNITVSGTINNWGNYCIVNTFSCNDANFDQNAVGSGLINSTLINMGITVNTGCTDCTVLNTTANNALVDNGTATRKSLNLP